MTLTRDALLDFVFIERTFEYSTRNTILYALGVGAGREGSSRSLNLVFEDRLQALPTFATVVAWDCAWIKHLGLNQPMIVHGEQRVTVLKPLAASGCVRSRVKIREAIDKGPDKGAILYVETQLADAESDEPLVELLSTVFARGDGGIGGPRRGGPTPHVIPDRPPDIRLSEPTMHNQALLFRLNGDLNPLHVDPTFARASGFPRPVLHGLCTYGVVARVIGEHFCPGDPTRVRDVAARFTGPVYPGDELQVDLWMDDNVVSFRASVADRGYVLDNGRMLLVPA